LVLAIGCAFIAWIIPVFRHQRLAQGDVAVQVIGPVAGFGAPPFGAQRPFEPLQNNFFGNRPAARQGIRVDAEGKHTVLINRGESPVGQLARRRDRSGKPLLQPFQVAAAERLRGDFERGQLQPAITANWSATVSSRRRSGGSSGLADLTDAALAARARFDRAITGVGPEFSGVLIDACCFLKGLETIERERLWPARSAKLVLQLALAALARHYGLGETAAGAVRSKTIRRWGADGYRPEIS